MSRSAVRFMLSFVLACGVLASARPAAAQELEIVISADSVTVGERFYLSVIARHDFASDPVFPEPDDSLLFGDLEVLRIHARDSYRRAGTRVDSLVYEVTTFALDTAVVAPIPVIFAAGEDTFTVNTPQTFVPVLSLVPDDAEGIRDLAPILEFPAPIWPYVVGALAVLLLAALIAFLIWRRRKRRDIVAPAFDATPAPAHVEALQRLRALESVDLTRREAIKPFYVELSDILRHYLARRLHVNAMESTTGELVRELHTVGSVPAEQIDRLRAVLSLSDMVKFADMEPPSEQGRRLLEESGVFVQEIERALQGPLAEPTSADA